MALSALFACGGGGPQWEMHRGGIVEVHCGRHHGDCYDGAASACPYGYDGLESSRETGAVATTTVTGNEAQTVVAPVVSGQMIVKCRDPIFCETTRCGPGFQCAASMKYPGRNVCALK